MFFLLVQGVSMWFTMVFSFEFMYPYTRNSNFTVQQGSFSPFEPVGVLFAHEAFKTP